MFERVEGFGMEEGHVQVGMGEDMERREGTEDAIWERGRTTSRLEVVEERLGADLALADAVDLLEERVCEERGERSNSAKLVEDRREGEKKENVQPSRRPRPLRKP